MRKVSIITVNFNQSNVTEALLQSINTTNSYKNIEIIVVDNGSDVNNVPFWSIIYPEILFLRSEVNLGFAGGNNLGIKVASGDVLFLVNNDTEFTPNVIERLIEVLEANTVVGMVSPKIRYFDKPAMLQYAGFTKMNYYTARNRCIGQFEIDGGQYDGSASETGFAHGAAMMIKKEALDKAGLMAENYFLYYEEMDWCEQIRKAGYQIWFQPNALIYHKESVSVGQKSALKEFFMNRNRLLFIRKNANLFSRMFFWIYFLFIVTPRNCIGYIKDGNINYILILLKSIWWNMVHSVNSKNIGFQIKRNV